MRAPATGERWEARRLLALLAAVSVAAAMFLLYAGTARADETYFLEVDGVTYFPSAISGPTRHYETPDTNPAAAHSDRNTWEGNGSENLPCQFGIHWIDNENVLTISNCLKASTTTSSVHSSTTSSVESSTTSSVKSSTTSSVESSTTSSVDSSTTSSVESSTTSSVESSTTSSVESSTTSSVDSSTTSSVDSSTTSSVDSSTTSSADTSTSSSTPGTTPVTEPDEEVKPTVVTTTPDEVDDDELPFTGMDSEVMVGLAVLLLGAGAALLAMTRRAEEN